MPETNDSQEPENPAPIPDPYGADPSSTDLIAADPTAALKSELPDDGEIDDLIDDSLTDDDFDAFVADEPASGFEEELGRTPPPPPPGAHSSQPHSAGQRRLVRDPYATLGGVSSGLAHYFGFDVTLVRLAVLFGSLSTGIGFLVYLAAWIMIPRAEYWPPAPPASGAASTSVGRSSISGRNLGLGILALGALLVFGFADNFGSFFVPFLLVAGGIWLLRQAPQVPAAAGVGAMPAGGVMPPPPTAAQGSAAATSTVSSPYESAWAGTAPVGKRSRGRRFARMMIITPMVLLPLVALAGVGALIVFDDDDRGGFNFTGGEQIHRPTSAAQLETFYEVDAGTIELDLSALDSTMFASFDEPVEVDVQVDFGAISVAIPEDLRVEINADADLGDLQVLGQSEDGPSPDINVTIDDPDVVLNLDVDLGEIDVVSVSGR